MYRFFIETVRLVSVPFFAYRTSKDNAKFIYAKIIVPHWPSMGELEGHYIINRHFLGMGVVVVE